MNKILLVLASLILSTAASTASFADPITEIEPSADSLDYGIVAGAFAPKPTKVVAGGVTYHVITPDLVEPACNSTQIVLWIEDENLPGDAGGIAYNLREQVSRVLGVNPVGDELEIFFARNDTSDCTKQIYETGYVKYTGDAKPLSIRRD